MLKSAEEFLECLISNEEALECPLPIFLISEELRDKDDEGCQISWILELETVRWWEWSGMILKTNPGRGSPQLQFPTLADDVLAIASARGLLLLPSVLESFLSTFFISWLFGGTAINIKNNATF